MDAYNPESFATDLEKLSQDMLDSDSNVISEEGSLSFEMLLEQEESQPQQTLEAEFADYTQQATVADSKTFDDSDGSIQFEPDSGLDLDLDFAAFETPQPMENADIDESQADFELKEFASESDDLQIDLGLNEERPSVLEDTSETEEPLELVANASTDMTSEMSLDLETMLTESESPAIDNSSEPESVTEIVSQPAQLLDNEVQHQEPEMGGTPQDPNTTIDQAEFDALQAQSDNQGALITKLEAEIKTLKSNYEQSQLASEQKVELEVYQSIKAEVQQLTAQVQDWEQRYDSLAQKLEQQTQLANNRIDPEVHASLNQQVQQYSEQVQTLQSEKEALEKTMQHWQSQAESKIDRMEYEAVFEQLQRLKERNARSLWTKIMDWVKGN